jgi:hypothetical protein
LIERGNGNGARSQDAIDVRCGGMAALGLTVRDKLLVTADGVVE